MSVDLETFGTIALSDRSFTMLREVLSEVAEVEEDAGHSAVLAELHALGG